MSSGKDADKLSALLYAERGFHFVLLAEEYERMSQEYARKAAHARQQHESYRAGAGVAFGERLGAEFERLWDENADKLYE